MATWRIDLGGVLSCFIKYPLRCKEVIERLEYQRVINPDHNGLVLSETEAVVFREMLGYFEYDYRMALLVTLDCYGIVRQMKVRLAVYLKNGTTDFIGIKSTVTASLTTPSQVMAKSRGISHSLRNEGLLWLVLGLLNLNSTTAGRRATEAPGTIRDLLSIHRSNL
ncbi:hypothetical protein FVEN_g4056 [Fusarium venenatum]|uniref:Uncharacterized protein n=2 Tax=Fusarium venenatum TaxID=56646 RepID=A0A2L2TGG8_9HYPO|nr:uncharacterized protein FVRRES_09265 [Fusarium venenatum]KAG8358099.1 hypothetical protein FVEN_g4056 [Fusarium venenatum]CEI69188.1 unnamed protein product [Fusarium venenatum]